MYRIGYFIWNPCSLTSVVRIKITTRKRYLAHLRYKQHFRNIPSLSLSLFQSLFLTSALRTCHSFYCRHNIRIHGNVIHTMAITRKHLSIPSYDHIWCWCIQMIFYKYSHEMAFLEEISSENRKQRFLSCYAIAVMKLEKISSVCTFSLLMSIIDVERNPNLCGEG